MVHLASLAALVFTAACTMAIPSHDEFFVSFAPDAGDNDNTNLNTVRYIGEMLPVDTMVELDKGTPNARRSEYKPNKNPIASGSSQAVHVLKTFNRWRHQLGAGDLCWDDHYALRARTAAQEACYTKTVDLPQGGTWVGFTSFNAGQIADWLNYLRGHLNVGFRKGPEFSYANYKSAPDARFAVFARANWRATTRVGCGYAWCDENAPIDPKSRKAFCIWDQPLPSLDSDEAAWKKNLPFIDGVPDGINWTKTY